MFISMNQFQNRWDDTKTALPLASAASVANAATNTTPLSASEAVSKDSVNVSGSRTEKATAKGECQTCAERRYVDGSDEGNVSFKAPGHIAPEASAGIVMSHEKEHVANAKREGNKPGNELLSATISLKTAICPECGRSYVAGGTTRTLIKYGNSEYDKNKKSADLDAVLGANVDTTA